MLLPIQIFVGQAFVKIDCPSLLRASEDSLNMDQLYFNIIYLLYVLKYIHYYNYYYAQNNDKQFAFTKVDFSQMLLPKTKRIVLFWQ